MLKVKTKIVTILFLILAVCFSTVALNAYKANADQTTDTQIIYAGASLRGGDKSGIRFTSLIEKDTYDELASTNNIEFHTLIVPTELLGEDALTKENAEQKGAKDILVGGYLEKTVNINGKETDFYSFNAVIYDIDAIYYGTKLTAVSYAKLTDKTDVNKVSYIEDTKKLTKVSDGYDLENADYIERSVLHVAQNLANNESALQGDKDLAQTFINNATGCEYSFDYTIEYYFDGALDASKTETKTVQCAYGATVTADEKDFDGYVLDETAENVKQAVVMADGSTVLKLYYKEDVIVLSTADDVYNFFNRFATLNADIDDNVVLANDIDMSQGSYDYSQLDASGNSAVYPLGCNSIGNDNSYGYKGTFDGKGHTITGLRVSGNRGLFGKVFKEGTVKNVSFVDAMLVGGKATIATWFGGTIENVYLDVTLRRADWLDSVSAICLVPTSNDVMTIKDSVIVAKLGKYLDGYSDTLQGNSGYGSCSAFVRDYRDGAGNINAIKYSNLTIITDLVNIFNNVKKETVQSVMNIYPLSTFGTVVFDKNLSGDYSVNASDILSGKTGYELAKITYNGNEIGAIENGVWTVPNSVVSEMATGDYAFTAELVASNYDNAVISVGITVKVPDQILYTATEVYNYFKTFENLTADIGGYTVLGADIDMSKGDGGVNYTTMPVGVATGGMSVGFTGIFDGNGHSIKGLSVANKFGLLCHVKNTATVRNVSFIGSQVAESANGFLATWFAGTLENVYLEVTGLGSNKGAICLQPNDNVNYMVAKNCVIVVTGGYSSAYAISRDYSTKNVFENVYVIAGKSYAYPAGLTDVITCYSVSEVESGNASFDKLDQNIWDLTGNYPTLK